MHDETDASRLTIAEVHRDEPLVIGFPAHVAIVLRYDEGPRGPGRAIEPALQDLPWIDVFSFPDRLGLTLADAVTGAPVLAFPPGPPPREPDAVATFDLPSGEPRRFLIDLGGVLDAITPGDYRLTLTYAAIPFTEESASLPVTLHAPTPAEARLRAALREGFRGTWGEWTWTRPRPLREYPLTRADPARYSRVLQYLLAGPEELDRVSPSLLDVLDGTYAPEALALRAELLWARGHHLAFEALRRDLVLRHPGLRPWLDQIAAGESDLLRMRRLLRPPAAER